MFLYSRLSDVGKTYKPYNAGDFNHFDFTYGRYGCVLYGEIIDMIGKHNDKQSGDVASKGNTSTSPVLFDQ